MATVTEALPARPRKASAGRRRRHQQQLPWRLHQIAPDAVTILVTPIWMDGTGRSVRHYLARAFDTNGQIIKFQAGGSRRIASLLQGAYPQADWNRAQTWHADTNTLTVRRPMSNADIRAGIQQLEARAVVLAAAVAFERERHQELTTARDFAATAAAGYIDRNFLNRGTQ
ncbi:hypothetical protein [Streptomyces swartbergensis]|uniref:Uncharacterized protein n=1 Tax=Streptomyces swartbergensis TaxID=487165 RepID=A0A243S6Y0_9ACTN|nr:hypothetical protein [Streptomyces swartbergensis]OUD03366.1 hypothetical protein CA983_10170 [Streptomyces swartbergensis]